MKTENKCLIQAVVFSTAFTILFCAAMFYFTGCASTGNTDQMKLIERAAVSYAVIKVIDKHPEKAAKVLAISHAVRQVAGTDGFNTVDLLMAFVRSKADFSKLDPADQMLAGVLLDAVQAELKSRVGGGVLTSDKLLIVGEVAGWIEDAAKMVTPPAV